MHRIGAAGEVCHTHAHAREGEHQYFSETATELVPSHIKALKFSSSIVGSHVLRFSHQLSPSTQNPRRGGQRSPYSNNRSNLAGEVSGGGNDTHPTPALSVSKHCRFVFEEVWLNNGGRTELQQYVGVLSPDAEQTPEAKNKENVS